MDRGNGEGMTPLMLASQRGHVKTVHVLIRLGARVDKQTGQGNTALMLATKRSHFDVMKVLLCHGAELFLMDSKGRTARHLATRREDEIALSLLKTSSQNFICRKVAQRMAVRELKLVRDAELVRLYEEQAKVPEESTTAPPISSPLSPHIGGGDEIMEENDMTDEEGGEFEEVRSRRRRFDSLTSNEEEEEEEDNMMEESQPGDGEFLASSSQKRTFDSAFASLQDELKNEEEEEEEEDGLVSSAERYTPSKMLPVASLNYRRYASKLPMMPNWAQLFLNCVELFPDSLVNHILSFLPLPPLFRWQLSRINNRAIFNPHQAGMDACRLLEDVLQEVMSLSHITRPLLIPCSPPNLLLSDFHSLFSALKDTHNLPTPLLDTLTKWRDLVVSILRMDQDESSEVLTLKSPFIEEISPFIHNLLAWLEEKEYQRERRRHPIHFPPSQATYGVFSSYPSMRSSLNVIHYPVDRPRHPPISSSSSSNSYSSSLTGREEEEEEEDNRSRLLGAGVRSRRRRRRSGDQQHP